MPFSLLSIVSFILMAGLSLSACESFGGVTLSLSDFLASEPHSLSGKDLHEFVGRYRMTKVSLIDHDQGDEVDLKIDEALPIELDVHKGLRYQGKIVSLELSQSQSFLEITPEHLCRFHWAFQASGVGSEIIDPKRASFGHFKTAGEATLFGCLKKNKEQASPTGLMPLQQKTYFQEGQNLVFRATEGPLEEFIYYDRESHN